MPSACLILQQCTCCYSLSKNLRNRIFSYICHYPCVVSTSKCFWILIYECVDSLGGYSICSYCDNCLWNMICGFCSGNVYLEVWFLLPFPPFFSRMLQRLKVKTHLRSWSSQFFFIKSLFMKASNLVMCFHPYFLWSSGYCCICKTTPVCGAESHHISYTFEIRTLSLL